MIDFMILSAPRSASTWAANWLTTERTLCLHDPVLEVDVDALDAIQADRPLGIACTAMALLPDLVNAHPARKVVVHRELAEVNLSLESIGLTRLGPLWTRALDHVVGVHIDYQDLFDPWAARPVYEFLTGHPFDVARHAQLRAMYVEPAFEKVKVVADRARAFRDRLTAALG